jgi:hypothetical protein
LILKIFQLFVFVVLGVLAVKIAFNLGVVSAFGQGEGDGINLFDGVIFRQGQAIVKALLSVRDLLEKIKGPVQSLWGKTHSERAVGNPPARDIV